MNEIALRLLQERIRIGLTQQELGKVGGVGSKTQRSYEKGISIPRADYFAKISSTGMDILYVLTGKPER
ncbi:helix-turn-helix transcriptional regulator [Pseudomonas sp. CCC3.2]|uniref:helix-turn-helix domain-containing protein n=1 Tax=unclassified Pseudomonas TaxID=196821 RepID=UPI002AB5C408|nr:MULTISPECIES: helix-turn-helix transcriptional regulator [unclassified Pseudomonas]MDY7558971.1 helix-turn-helix transcriptional regulator [Pseudomonas sp. AB6]MEA9976287.1 helix-turn-helix transcriptional regulator [Pseudomonas sp. RTS4]MEA9994319.1 helix-turn-helix transcriptional regulator [Pseudomonas sp. AA4]MEB0088807.1 helix-turn-helix transcriptional regulator [Pseudomonas sp. RTI1]MEB0126573.1 helix-turn-helix transcriptional regulator [Pseudomonas sp. CCC1.2]